MKKKYLNFRRFYHNSILATVFIAGNIVAQAPPVTQTFTFTGAMQQFTVPPCVGSMTIDLKGASGSAGGSSGPSGAYGGAARGVMTATPGSVMYIYVGGQGSVTTGGFNGGGDGGSSSSSSGGGGGGASDIRVGGTSLSNRIIVAAGGGGGGGTNGYTPNAGAGGGGSAFSTGTGFGGAGALGACASGSNGGEAGGAATGYGSGGGGGGFTSGGSGGGQPSAATGGWGCNGVLGVGGNGGGTSYMCGGATGGVNGGGGGGGGYYGGGGGMTGTGGCNGGGGGGSSWINQLMFSNMTFTSGVSSGHGTVTLTYAFNGSLTTATVNPFAICSGGTATINASGSTTYTWSNNSNASNIVVTPGSSTTYTVVGTNSIGCISSAIVTVTVNTNPPAISILSSTNSICPTNTVMLTASGGITYTWTGGVSNGVVFSPAVTSNYTVSSANGCGITTSVTSVTVTPLPVVSIASSTSVCSGNTTTLSAGGATTYTWMPGNITGASVIVSPISTTIYTTTGSSAVCSGVYTLSIVAFPNPTITTSASSSVVCAGTTVTLTASGASSFTWQSGPTTGPVIVVTPTTPVAYPVSGTNSFGCTTNTSQVVIANPSPVITVLASNSQICLGGSSTLTASGGSNYLWNTGSTNAVEVVNPLVSTVYTVTSVNPSSNCVGTQTVSVSVFTQTLSVSNSTAICMGNSVTLNASGATTYSWSNGSTSSSIFVFPTSSTVYSVSATTATNNMNCESSGTIAVTVNPNPTVTAVVTKTVICKGETTTITATGATTYSWNTTATTSVISISPTANTNYTVTGTNANGCVNTTTIQAKVSSCTGIESINGNPQNAISIYPNPSNGEFSIKSDIAINLSLINELGQTIRVVNLSELNNYQVTVSDLASGIYFVVGNKNDLKVNQKIVVAK